MAKPRKPKAPRCIVIAGPNGAGKTTMARELLLGEIQTENFINADFIAQGLSPFRPERAAVAAGKLMLEEIDRLVAARVDFAFETTLSGLVHAARLRRIKDSGNSLYRPLADSWVVIDNSGNQPRLLESGP